MRYNAFNLKIIFTIAIGILQPAFAWADTTQLKPAIFQQAVDHFGDLPGQTFSQKYYIDSEYATDPTTAPTILHICGEGPVEGFLTDGGTQIAKSLGANIVFLEHRYYGTSVPFSDLSTANLKYLTLDEAIEDLASFQTWISNANGWKGKWISIGGSYSGTLSALYRYQHPELVVGALAASAPMISGKGTLFGADVIIKDQSEIQDLLDIKTEDSAQGGDRPWFYEACTQVGFYDTDDSSGINSTLFSPDASACKQVFGDIPHVNIDQFNQKYDLPFLAKSRDAPSHILFTYGSIDVWTNLGLIQQTNSNPNIVIQMINGAGHHFDLNAPSDSDSNDVIAARNQFLQLARRWLRCSLHTRLPRSRNAVPDRR